MYKARSLHRTQGRGVEVSWRSRRWWPDKSSKAAGQVFEPDRPHKSLHVLGRRPKTKTLVTGLKAARASDMPSKSVGGRKLAGGFDSRPPPLLKAPSDQSASGRGGRRRARERARSELRRPRPPHKSFGVRSARHRTSLPTARRKTGQVFSRRPLEGEEGSGIVRPIERPLARKTVTMEDRRIDTFGACRRARGSNPCRQLAIHMKTEIEPIISLSDP